MYGFWGNPNWQSVAALIAFAGILVPVIIYLLTRNRKSLVFDIVTVTKLLPPLEHMDHDIQVLYKGEIVSDVWLVIITLINDGNSPIIAADYVSPISIDVGQQARILNSEIMEIKPKGIVVNLNSGRNSVNIEPLLLNAADSVQLKILATGLKVMPEVSGRIIGISRIRKANYRAIYNSSWWLFFGSFSFLLVILMVSVWFRSWPLLWGALAAWLAIIYVPTLYDYRYKKLWKTFMFG